MHLLLVSHDLPLMREPAEELAGSCAEAAKIGLEARESCASRLNHFHFRRCANHARDYGTQRSPLLPSQPAGMHDNVGGASGWHRLLWRKSSRCWRPPYGQFIRRRTRPLPVHATGTPM